MRTFKASILCFGCPLLILGTLFDRWGLGSLLWPCSLYLFVEVATAVVFYVFGLLCLVDLFSGLGAGPFGSGHWCQLNPAAVYVNTNRKMFMVDKIGHHLKGWGCLCNEGVNP